MGRLPGKTDKFDRKGQVRTDGTVAPCRPPPPGYNLPSMRPVPGTDPHLRGGGPLVGLGNPRGGLSGARPPPEPGVGRAPGGNFWTPPPVENPWDQREPLPVPGGADFEPGPGHYKYMLALPF